MIQQRYWYVSQADRAAASTPGASTGRRRKRATREPTTTPRPPSRIMVVAVMVSMVAFLDGTVVNLALPAIER